MDLSFHDGINTKQIRKNKMTKLTNPYSYEYFELGVRRHLFNMQRYDDDFSKSKAEVERIIRENPSHIKSYYAEIIPGYSKNDCIKSISPKIINHCMKDCAGILEYWLS